MGIQQQISEFGLNSNEYFVQPHKLGEWTIYKRVHGGTRDETQDWVGTIGDEDLACRIIQLLNNEQGIAS
jgi:hypothetical protein